VSVQQERAVLVSVALPNRPWLTDDPCDEIRGLAETARARVVGELTQKRHEVEAGTYIGKGKLAELGELVEATDADVVIFDNDLSPGQVRHLEQASISLPRGRARRRPSSRWNWPSSSTRCRG
jgi:GTPase